MTIINGVESRSIDDDIGLQATCQIKNEIREYYFTMLEEEKK